LAAKTDAFGGSMLRLTHLDQAGAKLPSRFSESSLYLLNSNISSFLQD
jgi:hypothetical protein